MIDRYFLWKMFMGPVNEFLELTLWRSHNFWRELEYFSWHQQDK
jgi:hypothetical protein